MKHSRRWRPLFVALIAVASMWMGGPANAGGGVCGTVVGFHYAGQITAHANNSGDCFTSYSPYYGWDGVNGQLTSPSTLAVMGDWTKDHVVGWLDVAFTATTGHVQTGWYVGTLNENPNGTGCNIVHVCIQSQSDYRLYTEYTVSGNDQVDSHGLWGTAASRTERIVYTGGGCYDVWTTYTFDQGSLCYSYPSSGAASVFSEVKNSTSTADTLPDPKYGTSSSGANEALRLHGATGFVPWTISLPAGGTMQIDQYGYTPCYLSQYTQFLWDFETYNC